MLKNTSNQKVSKSNKKSVHSYTEVNKTLSIHVDDNVNEGDIFITKFFSATEDAKENPSYFSNEKFRFHIQDFSGNSALMYLSRIEVTTLIAMLNNLLHEKTW